MTSAANADYLEDLNPAQRAAVEYMGGPALVIAGAGSGKTRVLTYRIAHLVRGHGVSPRRVIAITFTNKAAQEMKERIFTLVGVAARDMTIGTFHSACSRILRREIEPLGYSSGFSIYDELDSLKLIEQCLGEMGLNRQSYHPKALKAVISGAKSEMIDEDDFSASVGNLWEEVASQVYRRYQERLRENDALDFDDLLLVTVNLLELYPDVLRKYRDRYGHVLVDEYQDTNQVQYRLVRLLADEHRNLCVVGDDDQGIYSWRGADIRNILEFEKDYPDSRVFKLEQNYRSTPNILDLAGAVVKHNTGRKKKTLWTQNKPGEKARCYSAPDEHTEAAMVASEISRLAEEEGKGYSDSAVFYRTHAQSRVIEEAMRRSEIPYRIFGGTAFYQRKEIKDVVAFLRLITNKRDEVSLRRIVNVPPRGIGKKTLKYIEDYARSNGISFFDAMREADQIPQLSSRSQKKVSDFVKMMDDLAVLAEENEIQDLMEEVWNRTGYLADLQAEGTVESQGRIENLMELMNVVADFQREYGAVALPDFLERVSLVNDTDDLDRAGGYVSLMTLHNAKGLEFPVVFVVGMEEGIFPHARSMDTHEELEEERRLCYVGMTRAQEYLYLSHAVNRSVRGVPASNPPSRFLADEMPEHLLEEVEFEYGGTAETGETIEPEVGGKVVHAKWGPGTITDILELEEDRELEVEFDSVGTKRLLLSYAPLTSPGEE